MLRTLDLFSGVGGFAVGLKGIAETVAFCEISEPCQAVLNKRFPKVPVFPDVAKLKGRDFKGKKLDLITAGSPCTDLSYRGKQAGLGGEFSGLIQHVFRLVRELKPALVFLENVDDIIRKGMTTVLQIFDDLNYDCRWKTATASNLGAQHIRKRWFLVAKRRGASIVLPQTTIPANLTKLQAKWRTRYPGNKMMVPRTPQTRIRCGQMGNAIVPLVARVAFLDLVAGGRGRSTTWKPWHLPEVDSSKSMASGDLTKDSLTTSAADPPTALHTLPFEIVIVPPKIPKHHNPTTSPILTKSFTLGHWYTPLATTETVNTGSCIVTQRSKCDIVNQIRFSAETPAKHRNDRSYGANPRLLEFWMGYPEDWTLI